MLLVLQLPLADLRGLLNDAPDDATVGPLWELPPDPQRRGFLRGTGGLRKLNDAATSVLEAWPTEAWYVDARGALRLPRLADADFARLREASGVQAHPLKSLRRICSDGNGLWHLQLGVQLDLAAPANLAELRAVVADFLALPVQLRQQGAPLPLPAAQRWTPVAPLLAQRGRIAASIEACTTARAALAARTGAAPGLAAKKKLLVGTPLIYLETAARRRLGDADPASYMPASRVLDAALVARGVPLQMHFGNWPHASGDCALVWVEAGGAPPARLNNLRLNLLRLHAEREVLKLVLRSTTTLGQPGPALEHYLARAHKLLMLDTRFGNDQAALKAAFGAYDDLTAGERAAVQALLAKRGQTLGRVQQLLDLLQGSAVPVNVNIFEEGSRVNNVTIGNNSGQVNVDSTFTNSTNIIGSTDAGELKTALEQLLAATRQLAAQLPEAQREQVAKRTETIAREAASSQPDKEILGISAKGLIDAAKTVAELAKPIATAVGAVLGILGVVL